MALTDLQIRRTTTPGKYADAHGLFLQVAPTGGKYWRYAYRFDGKQKGLALGTYPDISLAKAREWHQDARTQLAQGIDPGAHKQAVKARKANTFEALAADWLSRQTLKDITRDKLKLWHNPQELPSGGVYHKRRSTSNRAMNEADRADYTTKALALWSRWSGIDVTTLRDEAERQAA